MLTMVPFSPTDEEKIASNVLAGWSSNFQNERAHIRDIQGLNSCKRSVSIKDSKVESVRFNPYVESTSSGRDASNNIVLSTHSDGEMLREGHDGSSDTDEDGVHGGRMKPLASLNANKDGNRRSVIARHTAKGLLSPVKITPLKVLAAARVGRRARHRMTALGATGAVGMDNCKENGDMAQVGDRHALGKQHRGIKRKSFGFGVGPEGMKMPCSGLKKKRSALSINSCSEEKTTLPLLACFESKAKVDNVAVARLGGASNPETNHSCCTSILQDAKILPACREPLSQNLSHAGLNSTSRQVNELPLFKASNDFRLQEPDSFSLRETPSPGLTLLGAAACLSLALDEALHPIPGFQNDGSSFTMTVPSSGGCPDNLSSDGLPVLGADLFSELPSMKPPTYPRITNPSIQIDKGKEEIFQEKCQPASLCQEKTASSAGLNSDSVILSKVQPPGHNFNLVKLSDAVGTEKSMLSTVKVEESSEHSLGERGGCPKTSNSSQSVVGTKLCEVGLLCSPSKPPFKVPGELQSKVKVLERGQKTSLRQSDQPYESTLSPLKVKSHLNSSSSNVGSLEQCPSSTTDATLRPPNSCDTLQQVRKASNFPGKRKDLQISDVEKTNTVNLAVEEVPSQPHFSLTVSTEGLVGHPRVVSSFMTLDTSISWNQGTQQKREMQDPICCSTGEVNNFPNGSITHAKNALKLVQPLLEQPGQKSVASEHMQDDSICNSLPTFQYFENGCTGNFINSNPILSGIPKPPKCLSYNILSSASTIGPQNAAYGSHNSLCLPKVRRGRQPKKPKICPQKKVQTNKFARISAPSGLLGGLNPGIINRLRDRKQVHAILGAVIGSVVMNYSFKKDTPLKMQEIQQEACENEQQENQDLHEEQKSRSPKRRKSSGMDQKQIFGTGTSLCANKAQATANGDKMHCNFAKEETLGPSNLLTGMDIKSQHSGEQLKDKISESSCSVDAPKPRNTLQAAEKEDMKCTLHNETQQSSKCNSQEQVAGTNTAKKGFKTKEFGSFGLENLGSRSQVPIGSMTGQEGEFFVQRLTPKESLYQEASHISNSVLMKESQQSATMSPTVSTAANVAARWLELLRLDIKGRLSALKRSRRRVRSVIVSGQLDERFSSGNILPGNISATDCAEDLKDFPATANHFAQDIRGQGHAFREHELEMDRWRALFLHMDGVLSTEGARLESWLTQISEMQSHCQNNQASDRSRLNTNEFQTAAFHEDDHMVNRRWISAETMEKNLAWAASAASIFSTANFATTMEIKT